MTFRWGILGTGFAARKFVLGLRQADSAVAVVVASRAQANAKAFAAQLSIPVAARSYNEAIAAAGVDAFYVATPPTEHRSLALACIAAGRPVLVEKPFASDAAAAREIIEAARAADVFCMEGMWTRFLPLVRRLKQMVRNGALGEIRMVAGSFCAPDAPDIRKGIFNPELAGGALLHRGVYPLSLATHLIGSPEHVLSHATIGETGVDEDTVVTARHAGGGLSVLHASLRTHSANDCIVMGTRVRVDVRSPIYRPYRMTVGSVRPSTGAASGDPRLEALKEGALLQGAHQRLSGVAEAIRRGRSKTLTIRYEGNGYHYEADEVMRCVRAGATESDTMPLRESVAIAQAMDAARAQWS